MSTQSQQPIIDIDAVPDIRLNTIELINLEAALDQPLTHTIPIVPQSRQTSKCNTDSQSDTQSELPEIVTQPPSSAAVSENESLREVELGGDLYDGIEGSDNAAEDWEHELDEAV